MLVVDRISNKSETQTTSFCFSLHSPQGAQGHPQLPQGIRLTSHCWAATELCCFFLPLRPDNSDKQAPSDINRAGMMDSWA